ncbi:MAG: methyltransferase domain-containing protein [Deltaproteobacteria bacterium]|nr:methyltransferase domain-containing protein [Deltaproteobacteria bacterium]
MRAAGLQGESYSKTVDEYRGLHDDAAEGSVDKRRENYTTLVNQYYDLATDFYEFGWGQSFHFATRRGKESFTESLARHERYLADAISLRPGMEAIDLGCGVGGPMREIARYSGAQIIGINNNAYQISRGEKHTLRQKMQRLTSFQKADFMQLPFEDASRDGAYTIEASCHAPDKVALFREVLRTLKPGASFAGYEWCLTPLYDAESARHRQIKKDIEEGDGLPDIALTREVDEALREAGFELVEARDVAPESDPFAPWYLPLTGKEMSLRSLPRTPLGRTLTNFATRALERVHLAPQGTSEVSSFLNRAADALVAGGETGIFTPMYFFHAKKPE